MEREELGKTLQTLVKYNNGFWKSEKQRNYLKKVASGYCDIHDSESLKTHFGITTSNSAMYYETEVRHADYGRKSYRRIGWMFVFDDNGITDKFRIRFSYDDANGCSWPNPEKTEQEWMRPVDAVSTMKVEEKLEKSPSQFLGVIGNKVSTTVTIKKMIAISGQVGYHTTYSDLIIMEDENGNCVTWKSSSAYKYETLKEGNTVTLQGTVKDHREYKGINQTVLTRCKLI